MRRTRQTKMDCLKLVLALLVVGVLIKIAALVGMYLSIRQHRKYQDQPTSRPKTPPGQVPH